MAIGSKRRPGSMAQMPAPLLNSSSTSSGRRTFSSAKAFIRSAGFDPEE
jgi:hypothetical protein